MSEDFYRKANDLAPTVTFGRLKNNTTIAAFANAKWERHAGPVRDSECMLLNLTNKYSVKARDHDFGGILCDSSYGPSFGIAELLTT